jgi:integrase
VFTTPIGTPVDPRNDYREFKKLLGKAGLPPVRLHDLRHTAASLLICWWRAWGSNPEPTD